VSEKRERRGDRRRERLPLYLISSIGVDLG
jgi:hypothetical protein